MRTGSSAIGTSPARRRDARRRTCQPCGRLHDAARVHRDAERLLQRDRGEVRGVVDEPRAADLRSRERVAGDRQVGAGRGCRVLPRRVRPASRSGSVVPGRVELVETEARLGRLLLERQRTSRRRSVSCVSVRLKPTNAMSSPSTPANTGELEVAGPGGLRSVPFAGRAPRVDGGVRVAPQQPPADEQRDLSAGPAARGRRRGCWARSTRGSAARPARRRSIPEVPERRAALVGRELAPQQLAVHLAVEPDKQRLDEARVGLQHRDRLLGDRADAGQEALGVQARRGTRRQGTSSSALP